MFTGIIEEVGSIGYLKRKGENAEIFVSCSKVIKDVNIGDSIAVDGVCLTVTSYDSRGFLADVSYETVLKTTLSYLKNNEKINLERALTLNTRLGGHLVLGHVDCIGFIKGIKNRGDSIELAVSGFYPIKKYLAIKGSVAVNGVSLTIADLKDDYFTVAVIPHTFEVTSLKYKSVGDKVNLEADIIARYVERLLQNSNKDSRLENMLYDMMGD
jgi:riboflavin synthase